MKVICIDDKESPADVMECPFDVWFGKIYTPIKEIWGWGANGKKERCYVFAEFPVDSQYNCWPIWRFEPLSDIDETTFERNYQKEKV